MEFFWTLLNEIAFLAWGSQLPCSTFEDDTVNVSSVLGVVVNLLGCFEKSYSGFESHVIKRKEFFSGCDLHDGCKEGHGVEEVADA